MRVTAPAVFEAFKSIGASAVTSSSPFLDWHLATSLALDLSENIPIGAEVRSGLLDDYNEHVFEAVNAIRELTGSPFAADAHVLVLERHEWITAVALSMEKLFSDLGIDRLLSDLLAGDDRVSESGADRIFTIDSNKHSFGERFALKTASALSSAQVGVMLSFLSHKVLGQFDWSFGGSTNDTRDLIYFSEPNVTNACELHSLDIDIFRKWIALHETVHMFQFKGHPWVRKFLYGMLEDHMEIMKRDLLSSKASPAKLFSVTTGVQGLTELSPQLRALFLRAQAFMAVVEGHADHVMAQLGARLPDYERYAHVFLGKKRKKNLLDTLMGKFLGFDMKIMQYKLGYKFIDWIHQTAGPTYIEVLWSKAENLPSYAELLDPALWLKRIDGRNVVSQ